MGVAATDSRATSNLRAWSHFACGGVTESTSRGPLSAAECGPDGRAPVVIPQAGHDVLDPIL